MGGPSAAIVLSELIALGLRARSGWERCGALADDLALGELVIARDAICADGTSRALGGGESRERGREPDRRVGARGAGGADRRGGERRPVLRGGSCRAPRTTRWRSRWRRRRCSRWERRPGVPVGVRAGRVRHVRRRRRAQSHRGSTRCWRRPKRWAARPITALSALSAQDAFGFFGRRPRALRATPVAGLRGARRLGRAPSALWRLGRPLEPLGQPLELRPRSRTGAARPPRGR